MPEHPRIALPFGQGLDRETGLQEMRPASMDDIRNVLLHQGHVLPRPGFRTTAEFLDGTETPVTHIVQGHPLRSERSGVVVSYQAGTKTVWIHRMDAQGQTVELLGEWENDNEWGSNPPRVHMAEVYGRVFIAHDERYVLRRAPTIYYDPIFGEQPLNTLTGEFRAGEGEHPIRFRGVVRHLAFLFGWGYGDESVDRPELVRVSKARDVTSFDPEHWFIAGNQREPVMICRPAGRNLVVLKESEGYVISGSGRDDFRINSLDPRFGCVGSQLATNLGGLVLAWSFEGPRVWDGQGPSDEISIPLELRGFDPTSLVEESDVLSAFAAYVPELRVVGFFFGQRVYALTTRVEGDWKWSYWTLPDNSLCAFTLYPGLQDTEAPVGYPIYSAAVAAGTYADVTWVLVDQWGDETLEVWLKPPELAWYLSRSVVVEVDSTQVTHLKNLSPGTEYEIAGRFRRGALYHPAYADPDPSTWPQVSRGPLYTAINPPSIVDSEWARVSDTVAQISLTIRPWEGHEDNDIEVYRNNVLIDTILGPHVGDVTFDDPDYVVDDVNVYQVRALGDPWNSPKSPPLEVWGGPAAIPVLEWVVSGGSLGYEVGIIPGDVTMAVQLWDNYDDLGGTGDLAYRATADAGETRGQSGALLNLPEFPPGVAVMVRLRHVATAFGVDDLGRLSNAKEVELWHVEGGDT